MQLKKFLTYLLIQVIFLIIISFIFFKLSRNDVWSGKHLEIRTDDAVFSVQKENNYLRVFIRNQSDVPFSIGFVYGFYRSPQLRYYYSLIHHDLAYQLKNKNLLSSDLLTRSFPLDSLSTILGESLSDTLKNYLRRVSDGINYGFHLRESNEKVPFVLYQYRTVWVNWTSTDLLKLFILRKYLLDQNIEILLQSILNNSKLNEYQEVLKKFNRDVEKFLYSHLPFNGFVSGDSESRGREILIFEKNTLPSDYIPIQIEMPGLSEMMVFRIGSPFPIFIKGKYSRDVFENQLLPEFHILTNKSGLYKKQISVRSSEGKPFYHEISVYHSLPVFQAGQLNLYLNPPNVNSVRELWITLYRLMFNGINTVRGDSQSETTFDVFVNQKKVRIPNPYYARSPLGQVVPVSHWQSVVLDSIRKMLPDEFRNDTLQSLVNMMKQETDLYSNYTILPFVWKSFFEYLSKEHLTFMEFNRPAEYYLFLRNLPLKLKIEEKFLTPFLEKLFEHNDGDFTKWRFELLFSRHFRYHMPLPSTRKLFEKHPISFRVEYGFVPDGIIFTNKPDEFWVNTLTITQDKMLYRAPFNDQINDPDFWHFNRELAE